MPGSQSRAHELADAETGRPVLVPGRPFVGPYRLCVELASGGMATVFLAEAPVRTGRHRYVALKQIHPHLARDRTFVDMFLDEARLASLIQHTHVCDVFDFGEHRGQQYLVMEYLVGEPISTLGRSLRRTASSSGVPQALAMARIIADAAEGLHAAHELRDASGESLGVVHRDVSPDNIFLTYDGVVKIVDFGVASATRQLHKTRTGIIKGKYAYLQPEVLRGEKPDRRADVWSLAVVLWELLTHERLFHRESDFLTLRAVADAELRPPSRVRREVPAELDKIVLRALCRDPAQRYQTARALADDLNGFIAHRREAVGFAQLAALMDRVLSGCKLERLRFIESVAAQCGAQERLTDSDTTPTVNRLSSAPPGSEPLPEAAAAEDGLRDRFPLSSVRTPGAVSYEFASPETRRTFVSILDGMHSKSGALAAVLAGGALATILIAVVPESKGRQPAEADSLRAAGVLAAPSPVSLKGHPPKTARTTQPGAAEDQAAAGSHRDESPTVPIELSEGDYVIELGHRGGPPPGLVLRIAPKKKPRRSPPEPSLKVASGEPEPVLVAPDELEPVLHDKSGLFVPGSL